MRCGSRFRCNTAPLTVDGHQLPRVDHLQYLGIVLTAGRWLSVDYSRNKASFYRGFNTVYSRCRFASTEDISTKMLNTVCIPGLLYGIEATAPSKSQLTMLDGVVYRSCARIFHTFDKAILHDVRLYFGVNSVTKSYVARTCKFLLGILRKSYCFAEFIFCSAAAEFLAGGSVCTLRDRTSLVEALQDYKTSLMHDEDS
jgi:hypothetical protein